MIAESRGNSFGALKMLVPARPDTTPRSNAVAHTVAFVPYIRRIRSLPPAQVQSYCFQWRGSLGGGEPENQGPMARYQYQYCTLSTWSHSHKTHTRSLQQRHDEQRRVVSLDIPPPLYPLHSCVVRIQPHVFHLKTPCGHLLRAQA